MVEESLEQTFHLAMMMLVTGACRYFCPQKLIVFHPSYFSLKSQVLLQTFFSHKEIMHYCIFSFSRCYPPLKRMLSESTHFCLAEELFKFLFAIL